MQIMLFQIPFWIRKNSQQYLHGDETPIHLTEILPTCYRVENPGKYWLKFDALPIVIKEMDKRVYQTFCFSSDIFVHQIKVKQSYGTRQRLST